MNSFIKLRFLCFLACFYAFATGQAQETKAPSYPLITHNPNFSIWSNTAELNASTTTHWTGADHSLLGLMNVDGNIYRFMGKEKANYKTLLGTSDEASFAVKHTEKAPKGEWMANALPFLQPSS